MKTMRMLPFSTQRGTRANALGGQPPLPNPEHRLNPHDAADRLRRHCTGLAMRSAPTSDVVIQDFLSRIAAVRPCIQELILFGSRARGTHRTDSDYDILVVVSHRDRALKDALYEAVMDVLLTHGRLVSLKIFPEQEVARLRALRTPFMTQVMEEGIRLG